MRGGTSGDTRAHTPPCEIQAATSSRSNPETLVVRDVLAHPHVVFHPCIYGFCGCAAAVTAWLR
jgi:hypothetical protein